MSGKAAQQKTKHEPAFSERDLQRSKVSDTMQFLINYALRKNLLFSQGRLNSVSLSRWFFGTQNMSRYGGTLPTGVCDVPPC